MNTIHKKLLTFATLPLLSLTLHADPFQAAPGTKAKSMGYAYSAIANNTSAMYYNPAGLATLGDNAAGYSVFTFELGNVSKFDASESNTEDQFGGDLQYFIGGGYFNEKGGVAVGMYSLYDIYHTFDKKSYSYWKSTTTEKAVAHQQNDVIHLATAFKLGSKLSLGLGFGYVTNIFGKDAQDDSGIRETHNGYDMYDYDASGSFYQYSLLAQVFKLETGLEMKAAYTFRSEAEMEEESNGGSSVFYENLGIKPFNVPEETVIGIGLIIPTESLAITLSADKKNTKYTYPDVETDTMAFGIELGFDGFDLRAGKYSSTPVDETTAFNFETSGTTFGIHKQTVSGSHYELSVDKRTNSNESNLETNNTYVSVSFNKAW